MHPDCAFIKTSTDNSHWQTERCSDDRNSRSLYASGKAHSNLVVQSTLPGVKRPSCMGSAFLGKCASTTYSGIFEIRFLEVFSSSAEARLEII